MSSLNGRYDLVVRGGSVVDGTGAASFTADLGITDGRISAVGDIAGQGREEIDASGKIVVPGFVDIHTHYDGQATWEARMQPSSGHGVTTVIAGNCGVGFAPCRPEDRDVLVKVMEGVEDVPEVVMAEGLPWAWESFAEYLAFLDGRRFDIDIGVQAPHSAIRVFAMGQRGADREPATDDDIARMRDLVVAGMEAGAFGVSTSRSLAHRRKNGDLAPSVKAAEAELLGLAEGLRTVGAGVFQIIPDSSADPHDEFALIEKLSEASGRPLSFSLLATAAHDEGWRTYLRRMGARTGETGPPIRAQIYPRPVGVLFGLELSFHPFRLKPSFQPLVDRPLAEKVAAMRDPDLRRRLLTEPSEDTNPRSLGLVSMDQDYYLLGDPPRYDPPEAAEVGRLAAARGVGKAEMLYDLLLSDDGKAILYRPGTNFIGNSLDSVRELLRDPNTIVALGDGGAHYGMICDASYPTFLLTYWVRDAAAGQGLDLPTAVKALTADPSRTVGLHDRGVIAVGKKADLNVIDLQALRLHAPSVSYDLPKQGRRLRQTADGYSATIVNGTVTYREGKPTGALPGRLIRRPH